MSEVITEKLLVGNINLGYDFPVCQAYHIMRYDLKEIDVTIILRYKNAS